MNDFFISIDIETSGPIPGDFSILSIGACDVFNHLNSFYCELKPLNNNFLPEAISVSGLDFQTLKTSGVMPEVAIQEFGEWVLKVSQDRTPVFVGFNAGFDWSFINWYFHKFTAQNPFGHAPLDIKSLYMGVAKCKWSETKLSKLPFELKGTLELTHNALDDARTQGLIAQNILKTILRS